MTALYGTLGILLSVIDDKVFDLIDTKIDVAEEIRKGNMSAAVVIGTFLLGVCFIIARAVGS